jgi:TetR/AcrR family transcriptional regulator, ethionamide resistance regulator
MRVGGIAVGGISVTIRRASAVRVGGDTINTVSTTRKRIRRRPEVAEAEILDAASELLADSDFRDLTVGAVMERTGMKRAAFYNYFDDRNDLVMRLLGRIEDEMMGASSVWLEDQAGGPARLREALKKAIGVYARHGHVLRAAHEAAFHDEAAERHYRYTLVQAFIDAVARRIRAENHADRAAVPDPEEVARALVLMNATVLAERLGRPPKDRPESVIKAISLMWTRVIYGRDIRS